VTLYGCIGAFGSSIISSLRTQIFHDASHPVNQEPITPVAQCQQANGLLVYSRFYSSK